VSLPPTRGTARALPRADWRLPAPSSSSLEPRPGAAAALRLSIPGPRCE
jgi:hypothetical protein